MRCTLSGHNAKIFAKAIQSLSRFGSDLFIEADNRCLQMRALNASQSAIGSIKFNRIFFQNYKINSKDDNYFKLSMKACLHVFRNMKQVEYCDIALLSDEGKFQVQLKCRLETIKNSVLTILDEQSITMGVLPEDMSNIVVGSHKLFTEISHNFQTAIELTLEAYTDAIAAKNFVEGSRVNDKFMRSQLKLSSREFESYKIENETNITFCLKEFRAFLLFAEALNEDLKLSFEDTGSPAFVTMKKLDQVECLLIMSTLLNEDVSFLDEDEQHTSFVPNATITRTETNKRKMSNPETENAAPSKANKQLMKHNVRQLIHRRI